MIEFFSLIFFALIGLFRSRTALEAENLVLRHQLNILRRKSPKRPTLSSIDRLIFAGLYGSAPGVLSALALVRPETVIRDKPIAPASPWQNGFAERLIGSIRRECLDHMIVLGEAHLRWILQAYACYYNNIRTHRSLDKDAPAHRPRPADREYRVTRDPWRASSPLRPGLGFRYTQVNKQKTLRENAPMTTVFKMDWCPIRMGALLAAGILAAANGQFTNVARAEYPDRPIHLVVCFAPGGVTDITSRLITNQLSALLGQPVVIENHGGAGGNIAMGLVARARPDGYTLLGCSSAFVVNPSLYRQVPYDPVKDFAPIATISDSPNVLVVSANSKIKTFSDLLETAKADPMFNYTSPGAGTTAYLAVEIVKLEKGVNMVHIPFPGAAPAGQAVLAGNAQMLVASMGSVAPQIKAGLFHAIAQTGLKRWKDLPDVPTLLELGIKQGETETFQGFFAPAGTPQPIIDRIAGAIAITLKDPELQTRFRTAGQEVLAEPPAVLKERVAKEVAQYKEIIDKGGLQFK